MQNLPFYEGHIPVPGPEIILRLDTDKLDTGDEDDLEVNLLIPLEVHQFYLNPQTLNYVPIRITTTVGHWLALSAPQVRLKRQITKRWILLQLSGIRSSRMRIRGRAILQNLVMNNSLGIIIVIIITVKSRGGCSSRTRSSRSGSSRSRSG